MSAEPRLMKHPNGGMLNVDVTLLRMGLSRCRSFAEDALAKSDKEEEVDWRLVVENILEEARNTLEEKELHDGDAVNEANLVVERDGVPALE